MPPVLPTSPYPALGDQEASEVAVPSEPSAGHGGTFWTNALGQLTNRKAERESRDVDHVTSSAYIEGAEMN